MTASGYPPSETTLEEVTYANTYAEDVEPSEIVLVGIDTENPVGADTPTTELDEPQATSLFVTWIA